MSQTNTKITQNMPDHTAVWKVQYHQLLLVVLVDNLKTKTDKEDIFSVWLLSINSVTKSLLNWFASCKHAWTFDEAKSTAKDCSRIDELAQITQRNKWTCSVLAFTNLQNVHMATSTVCSSTSTSTSTCTSSTSTSTSSSKLYSSTSTKYYISAYMVYCVECILSHTTTNIGQ